MLVSLNWLRALCPFLADAARTAAALTARGLTVDSLREDAGDAVLDVDVPANRPDCLGHLGLARELSAAFEVPLAQPAPLVAGRGDPVQRLVRVEIDAPDLCGRYTARLVRGVQVGPSPAWVVARLEASGLRSLNNVVDVSNLVLLETGHPIHTFDFQGILEGTIRVRRARSGERLITLDGVDRALDPSTLVIADAGRAVAIAGVMGGADSQILAATRDVLIEAAWFLPSSVRSTARRLGLATDSSHRFERGADPEGVIAAQDLAVRLLVENAHGTPSPGTVDVRPVPFESRTLRLRTERLRSLLGFEPEPDSIERSLGALGLSPVRVDDRTFEVRPPSFRVDLEREADLVEEVARHLGYDRIPARLPRSGGDPPPQDDRHAAAERSRDALAHAGFQESFCYSMIAVGEDDRFVHSDAPESMALINPIAEPMARLRRSLLPGLVRTVDFNVRRGARDVRLFEVGSVFHSRPGRLPVEPLRIGLAWCGAASPRHWSGTSIDVALHDMTGIVQSMLERLRPGATLRPVRAAMGTAPPAFHPGRMAVWSGVDGSGVERAFAWAGALHPDVRRETEIPGDLFLAELDLDRIREAPAPGVVFTPLPKLPSAARDLSLVVDGAVPFESIRRALAEVAAPASVEFEVADRYEGPPLNPGEVSLTVRVILQPLSRTLTDAETERYRAALVETLSVELGIRLRE